jgi:hypothetical protein
MDGRASLAMTVQLMASLAMTIALAMTAFMRCG